MYFSKGAAIMCRFIIKNPPQAIVVSTAALPAGSSAATAHTTTTCTATTVLCGSDDSAIFTGYLSDISISKDELDGQGDLDGKESGEAEGDDSQDVTIPSIAQITIFCTQEAPALKQHKTDIPARTAHKLACEQWRIAQEKALHDIEGLIRSACNIFVAGQNGLQSYHMRAVQGCLQMVVNNQRGLIDASQRAAESQGFAENWGGQLVCCWVRSWVRDQELPISSIGRHRKVFSLLNDPAIRAELCSYIHSNKWAMDPEKLAEYSQNAMVPAAAEKYLHHIVTTEIPMGLRQYLELKLFPRIHLKICRGISLQTAHHWLHHEGFQYTEHKKALYYDGHERPDVVQYWKEVFLPAMAEHQKWLIEYVVGDVETEVVKIPENFVERHHVICTHDEMTAQANDGKKKSWVMDGEYVLKKKGQGRGIHHSDVICSTFGWLKEASQTLEYGKNYDGYWNGELFVKQVTSFIFCNLLCLLMAS